ncbi:MAG: hypothetical protein IKM21_00235 [Oscillospiraceae bacterium]|nr:hypothetical protein [Oscillospiraceae bacterium]
MDWRICTEDDLRRYKQMKIGLLNSKERLQLVSETMRSPKTSLGERSKRAETEFINAMVEMERLSANINSAQKLINIIERGLASLSPEDRKLLEKFYMSSSPSKMRHLSDEFGYEARTLYRKRERALTNFTIAMYGLELS